MVGAKMKLNDFFKHINKYLLVIFAMIMIVGIGLGTYVGSVLWIKKVGIHVQPKSVIPPVSIRYFLQNDPEWKSDRLGSSNYTLGGSGCLVTVLAASMNHLGVKIDPQKLNNLFTDKGVYTGSGEIIWYKIKDAVPEIDYSYQRVFHRTTLENDLKQGKLPIIQVKYYSTGIFHWVLVVGTDEDDFLIMDPLQQDKKFIKLSTHGRIYAYRVLIKNQSR